MGTVEGFLYGMFGGLLAELLGLFKRRHQARDSLPEWVRSPFYWFMTCVMILAGGALVVVSLKSSVLLNALLAVNVGASAPFMIGSLAAQAPPVEPGRVRG